MLKRFEKQKTIFTEGLSCLGYSVSFDSDYCAILSNYTDWDFELAGDPRDDFFLTSLIYNKRQKKFSLNILMEVFLRRDPCEGILYCTIGITNDIFKEALSQVDFILENRELLFDDLMRFEDKYNMLDVVPWWACLNGVPPDLSFLYE